MFIRKIAKHYTLAKKYTNEKMRGENFDKRKKCTTKNIHTKKCEGINAYEKMSHKNAMRKTDSRYMSRVNTY